MRRATITIPDDLAKAVDNYVKGQAAQPALTAVVQPHSVSIWAIEATFHHHGL